jgi:DNA repair protein RecO
MKEPASRYISFYGILIKRSEFGEGNTLLTVIDREKGLFNFASYGSSREKSSRREALLVTQLISGVCTLKDDESLPSLKEASIEKSFDGITTNFHALSYIFLIFEILSNILRKEEPFALFQILLELMERINQTNDVEKYSFYFITKFFKTEGFLPSFQSMQDYRIFMEDLEKADFRLGNGTIRFINDIYNSSSMDFLGPKKISPSVIENLISFISLIMRSNFQIELKSLSLILS